VRWRRDNRPPQHFQHAVKMSDRKFDVEVLALPGSGLGRHQPAATDVLEVAVRKLVTALPVRVLRVVDPEMPSRVLQDPVLLDELVLLPGGWLVLAPCITVIDHTPARRYQVPRVLVCPVVQFDRRAYMIAVMAAPTFDLERRNSSPMLLPGE
jgi:hypothetical protein